MEQRGPGGVIWFLKDDRGRCAVDAFMGALPQRAKAQFKARFDRITEVGALRTPEMGRFLVVPGKPKIFEIKVDHGPGYRLYVVRMGTDWVVTHGRPKPKNSSVADEATRARDLFAAGGGSV